MTELKHGTVSVTVADDLTPPPNAGKLSPDEIRRLPKARRGLGLVCEHTADAIEKLGGTFTLPSGVTAASLVAAGHRADAIDQVIVDLKVVLATLEQANLLFEADAWEQIRKVNDQVKAQLKHAPQLAAPFTPLIRYFERSHRVEPAAAKGPAATDGG